MWNTQKGSPNHPNSQNLQYLGLPSNLVLSWTLYTNPFDQLDSKSCMNCDRSSWIVSRKSQYGFKVRISLIAKCAWTFLMVHCVHDLAWMDWSIYWLAPKIMSIRDTNISLLSICLYIESSPCRINCKKEGTMLVKKRTFLTLLPQNLSRKVC